MYRLVLGLVHVTRISKELLTTIKSMVNSSDLERGKSELEQLFHVGDVVRCRIHSVSVADRKVNLSMLARKVGDATAEDSSDQADAGAIYIHGRESEKVK